MRFAPSKLVNSAGEEIDVVNSTLTEDAERGVDWALEHLAQALDRRERASWLERVKTALIEALKGSERAQPSTNSTKDDDDMDKVQFDALSQKVDALSESTKPEAIAAAIGNAVTEALKPVTDQLTALQNDQKAKDEAELTELRGKIVKANLMDEDAAKELTLNAARALAKTAEPGEAAPIVNGFTPRTGEKKGHVAPKAVK